MTGHMSNIDFEIIISTMNRDSLAFLNQMFIHESYENFNLLIINQTTESQLLVSNSPNVRVINSFDKGLSNSRNLALKNTIGLLCLIADDDVVYTKDFKSLIVLSFENHRKCDVITFKMIDNLGVDFKTYPNTFTSIPMALALHPQIVVKLPMIKDENWPWTWRMGIGFYLSS